MKQPRANPPRRRRTLRWPHAAAENHAFTAVSSLGRLARRPVTALLTVLVVAVALALPLGLFVLLKNAQALSASWERTGEVSVFMAAEAGGDAARATAGELRSREQVRSVHVIDPEEALEQFRSASQFSEALEALTENPLPYVLVLDLERGLEQGAIAELVGDISALPAIDFAQFDMDWLIRFNAILRTVKRLIEVIAGLLMVGVLLIVGNTIRLDIQNRREEIEITKMLGGTDAFIRRPFLYGGLWYGLLGGLLALLLVYLAALALADPLAGLVAAYDSGFAFRGLTAQEMLTVVFGGGLIGLVGSWLAVGRHLAAIKPG